MPIRTEFGQRIEAFTATNLVAGTYYYPTRAGDVGIEIAGSGFEHVSFPLITTQAGACTYTFTLQISADSVNWIDVTPSVFDGVTNADGNATYPFANPGGSAWLDRDDLRSQRVRLKLIVVNAAAANNTLSGWAILTGGPRNE